MQTPLVVERVFHAPIDKVWSALTNAAEMKHWYFDIPSFEASPGFEFQFLGGTEHKKYLHLCKVIEVVPGKKLSYSWRYDGYEGYSVVTFLLNQEGKDKTRLTLTHEGLESFPATDPNFARGSFSEGWNYIVGKALVKYLENA